MNPNGYSGYTLNQFQDPGPLQDGCDGMTCTDRVGGEHSPTCNRCYFCRRLAVGDLWVNVSLADGTVVSCCDTCYERGDEGVSIPLDYTEDEPLREGLPEFNGAFKSW